MSSYRKQLFNLMNRIHPIDMNSISFDDFCRDFFFCPGGDTLRLRNPGLRFFEKHFNCYDVSWQEEKDVSKMSSKHISWLAQHCKSIYYIGSKKIVLFDQEEAFLFQLLDADIDDVANSGGM